MRSCFGVGVFVNIIIGTVAIVRNKFGTMRKVESCDETTEAVTEIRIRLVTATPAAITIDTERRDKAVRPAAVRLTDKTRQPAAFRKMFRIRASNRFATPNRLATS